MGGLRGRVASQVLPPTLGACGTGAGAAAESKSLSATDTAHLGGRPTILAGQQRRLSQRRQTACLRAKPSTRSTRRGDREIAAAPGTDLQYPGPFVCSPGPNPGAALATESLIPLVRPHHLRFAADNARDLWRFLLEDRTDERATLGMLGCVTFSAKHSDIRGIKPQIGKGSVRQDVVPVKEFCCTTFLAGASLNDQFSGQPNRCVGPVAPAPTVRRSSGGVCNPNASAGAVIRWLALAARKTHAAGAAFVVNHRQHIAFPV